MSRPKGLDLQKLKMVEIILSASGKAPGCIPDYPIMAFYPSINGGAPGCGYSLKFIN
jgi:hypothetical protein